MSKKIVANVNVAPGANQNYGQLVVDHIAYDDGSSVTVKDFLGVEFKSPAAVKNTDFWGSVTPWQDITADITSTQVDSSTFVVKAKLGLANGQTFGSSDTLNFGINGNLTGDAAVFTTSFAFAADEMPDTSGVVNVDCAAAPDSRLASNEQSVTFAQGQQVLNANVPLGKTTPVSVAAGTFTVTVDELKTSDETVVAAAQVSPTSVTVKTGEKVDVKVTYGTVNTYCSLDVTLGALSELENEQFHVTVTDKDSGNKLADFTSPSNHTTSLRRLAPSGTAVVSVGAVALNNVEYSFDAKSQALSVALVKVSFAQADVKTKDVDTTGFVKLPVLVETELSLDRSVPVRLSSSKLNYTLDVPVKAASTAFQVPAGPGQYTVLAPGFVDEDVVYFVNMYSTLDVAPDGSSALQLSMVAGPSLRVRGFPNFLSFGGCADLTPGNQDDFVAARASSVFKYAGVDGAGDAGSYLTDDTSTRRTLQLARDVEAKLADGNPVLPVLVSYTVNLSLGDIETQLQSADRLAHSFANYMLSLRLAMKTLDDQHPVPAGYVVNPDFLGACQQHPLQPDYQMPVREPLQTALDYWSVEATIPESVTNTLRGYVLAVNWLTRTVAPAVTFGWQVNLWGVGRSEWIYSDPGSQNDPSAFAQQTADYVKSMGVFDGDNVPDFLAVDRYEADDYTVRSYANGYCYGPRDWGRYYDFCRWLSVHLRVPVMPWQIPSSHTALVNDPVNDNFDSQHWGTGGSYLFGDPGVGSNYHNVNSKLLSLQFSASFPDMGQTGQDIWTRSEPFDLTNPAYTDFALRGIFTMLLGGGSTTGIISSVGDPGPWVRNKLNAYMKNPLPLTGTSGGSSSSRKRF